MRRSGVVTLTTGYCTVLELFVTMVRGESSKLTPSTHSKWVRLLVAWSQERELELHVYIDGVDNGIVWTELPIKKSFWGVADVYAHTKKIQLVSGEWLLSIAVSHVPHPDSIIFLLSCQLFLLSESVISRSLSTNVPLYRQLIRKLSITKPQEPPTIRHCEDQVSNPQATPPHQTSSETAKDVIVTLHQQNDRLQQDNARLQQDNARLQQEVTSLQQDNAHLKQDYQQEVTRLQQEVTHLQQENAHLKQDREQKATQFLQGMVRFQQLNQQEVTRLQQDNSHLQQEITHLRQTISQLQQDNAQLQQDHQDITHLKQETRELQSWSDQQPKLGSDTDISFWVVSHNEVQPTGQVLGEGGWGRV